MTSETIFTSQTPSLTDAVSGVARQLGMKWSTSASGKRVTGGRVWIPDTGKPTGMRWQLWQAPSTLLQDILLDSMSGSANSWMTVTGVTPQNITASQNYYVTEYFPSTAGGNYSYRDNGGPITSGDISANVIFRNGGTSNDPPTDESLTGFLFFADIVLDDAPISGTLQPTLPASIANFAGTEVVSGLLQPLLPASIGHFAGTELISGTLQPTLPAVVSDFDGTELVSGVLQPVLPAAIGHFDGLETAVTVQGILQPILPAAIAAFTGDMIGGGSNTDPCGWVIPDPLCCTDWTGFSAGVKAAAKDYAATVLWAATGRQYGVCTITVRPCGVRRRQSGWEFFGYDWTGGTWIPYIFNGQWFNCVCPGICSCEPRCQVRLMGPVNSIVEVTVGGVVVDPSAYRVDDGHWLVRTDGDCWPFCVDMDSDDGAEVFEVTYARGTPPPSSLLRAASTLACEWGKACTGGDCRLSPRVASVVRNGITIDMMDPSELLDGGLTGLWEVDAVIVALNPYRNKQRLRIYAPELNVPRMRTS